MIKEIDAGHRYLLKSLDGDSTQQLQFVKRVDKNNIGGGKFPGNYESYPGTTLQSVLRCLILRLKYLQWQIPCKENSIIIFCLKFSIWLLEIRAAKRHHRRYYHGLNFASSSKMCLRCGHTDCEHLKIKI